MLARFYALTLAALALFLGCTAAASAQSYPPTWSATGAYAIGDQVQMSGNVYRAIKAVPANGPTPTAGIHSWELYYVRANTTLMIGVGQTFPDLTSAWTYSLNATIAGSATLTLYISTAKGDFTEKFGTYFNLDHPFGSHINIEADHVDNTLLSFPKSSGFYLDSGHAFGSIGNLQVTSSLSDDYAGFYLTGNSSIYEVYGMVFNTFEVGVYAEKGAQINCGNDLIFSGVAFLFFATANGAIDVDAGLTFSNDNLNTDPIMEIAFYANNGGQIIAEGATMYNAKNEMAYAATGGHVDVSNSTFGLCPIGVVAEDGGRIIAPYTKFSGDTKYDIAVSQGGTVDAVGATYSTHSVGSNDGSYIW